jgi:hypothetical protein
MGVAKVVDTADGERWQERLPRRISAFLRFRVSAFQ